MHRKLCLEYLNMDDMLRYYSDELHVEIKGE